MRILYCNKYNFRFSGTESYLFETMELMRVRGHEVALFSTADRRGAPTPYDQHFVTPVDFKQAQGLLARTRLAARAIYSREARQKIRAIITNFVQTLHTCEISTTISRRQFFGSSKRKASLCFTT